MLGPNSWLFLIVLIGAFAGILVWLVRAGHLALKVTAGVLAFAVSTLFGAGLVNNFYDYYTSWTALYDDLTNSGAVGYTQAALAHPAHHATFGAAHATTLPASPMPATVTASPSGPGAVPIPQLNLRAVADPGTGRVVRMQLSGAASGITRIGYVYLPPQYFEPAYADARFPVLELLHGDPGEPNNWIYGLHLASVMDAGIHAGRIGPMVIVMPGTFSGQHGNDCVDGVGGLNETYLTKDVPADVVANFRVVAPGSNWGVGGLSDGGFCAANLALRHRGNYGAVVSMDGFFSVQTDLGVLRRALGGDPGALAANDPVSHVGDPWPLPRFWVMAGNGNRVDLVSAEGFRTLLQAREPVEYVLLDGGQHTPSAWRAVLPDLLGWAWTTLSGQPSPTGTEVMHLRGGGLSTPTPSAVPPKHASPAPSPTPSASTAAPTAVTVVAAPTVVATAVPTAVPTH